MIMWTLYFLALVDGAELSFVLMLMPKLITYTRTFIHKCHSTTQNSLFFCLLSAYATYEKNLDACRLGCDGIVINLASAAEAAENNNKIDTVPAYASRTVIGTENVDVAYLLQRLLPERVKYLVKAAKVRPHVVPFENLWQRQWRPLFVISWQSSWSGRSLR